MKKTRNRIPIPHDRKTRGIEECQINAAKHARMVKMCRQTKRIIPELIEDLVPSDKVFAILEELRIQNPSQSYAQITDQIFTEWLIACAPRLTLADMIAGLRSPVRKTRERFGRILACSIGIGLQESGTDPDDFQHIIAPDLTKMLDAAIDTGNIDAIEALERFCSNIKPVEKEQSGKYANSAPVDDARGVHGKW